MQLYKSVVHVLCDDLTDDTNYQPALIMRFLAILSFLITFQVAAQDGVRFEVTGTGGKHDMTYVVKDSFWELQMLTEGAAVFIYDRGITYTIFNMDGAITIAAAAKDTGGIPRPIILTLPLGLTQGTTVRVVCEPKAAVLFMRYP